MLYGMKLRDSHNLEICIRTFFNSKLTVIMLKLRDSIV